MSFKLLTLQLGYMEGVLSTAAQLVGYVEDVLQTADTTTLECMEGVLQAADTTCTTGICGRCPKNC